MAPIWRQVTTYPHLVDQVLAGSPEELSLHELHAGAWAVVETLFAARQPTGVGSTLGGTSSKGDRALRDVLELAAVTTLLKGGTVYALPAGAAPGGGSTAAVFRYEAGSPRAG
jgi:hypothetical protein